MKKYLEQNVYDAAVERINFIFDHFEKVCVSFSGGKDSTVLLHLTHQIATERNRLPIYILFVDLEGQYNCTIEHIHEMLELPGIIPYWICLPLNLRNAVSVFEPHWVCWDETKKDLWVRELPDHPSVISDQNYFPFFRYRMEFEDFVPAFQEWLAEDDSTACLVGIRADESLNRYRAIVRLRESRFQGKGWTNTNCKGSVTACYPIYDWRTEDIWAYIGKEKLKYNRLYDFMYLTGKSIHEMRICQPYGDDQRKGLDQFHQIEPETWFRIVQRVSGANMGNIYCGQKMLGYHRGLGLPKGHTWESYTKLLLSTMPPKTRNHFEQKYAVYIDWWKKHGYEEKKIPDHANRKDEAAKKVPSWRRMCLCILKNDFWCKSLSFSMTKELYEKYYKKVESGEFVSKLDLIKEKYKDI